MVDSSTVTQSRDVDRWRQDLIDRLRRNSASDFHAELNRPWELQQDRKDRTSKVGEIIAYILQLIIAINYSDPIQKEEKSRRRFESVVRVN